MKKNLKKLFALGCTAALTLTTAGCSSSTSSNASEADTTAETSQEASADKKIYNVAIVKQLDHASLDEIANAVEAELDKIAEDNNVAIYYELYSGQNDQTTLKQIGDQAVADGVDAIIPIATLAAQVATVSAQQTQTPVVYAAVSDPEAAELTGIDYVTGTSDALNTEKIMDMIFAANPDVKNVGLLYSLSEANSTKPIADAKAYLDEKGISYTEQTANTNDEVITAASSLVADKVDAVFTPTDNVIMQLSWLSSRIWPMQASRTMPALILSSAMAHLPPAASTTRLLVHRPLTLLIRQSPKAWTAWKTTTPQKAAS